MLSDLQTYQISSVLILAAAVIVLYLLFTAWIVERAHNWRMRLADLGAKFISQDSQATPEEQRLVAWMLKKAYSSRPMLELTLAYPSAVWGILWKATRKPDIERHPYDRLRSRTGGTEFVKLFALSIMAANIPLTFVYIVLNAVFSPALTMRGGTDRATETAVDRVVSSHDKDDNGMVAA